MKAVIETTRKYYKYVYENWTSPLLDSNGTAGVSDFAVWGSHNQWVNETWRAFHTASGYTTNYYIGNYGNEYSTTLYVYMHTLKDSLITSYTVYSPTISSNSDWGSISSTRFYGSNDCVNWVQLHSTGNFSQDAQQNFSFSNNNYYKFYQYQMTTYGSGHKDQSNICSFRISGIRRSVAEGTASNYSYYIDTTKYKIPVINNQYKACKF